ADSNGHLAAAEPRRHGESVERAGWVNGRTKTMRVVQCSHNVRRVWSGCAELDVGERRRLTRRIDERRARGRVTEQREQEVTRVHDSTVHRERDLRAVVLHDRECRTIIEIATNGEVDGELWMALR